MLTWSTSTASINPNQSSKPESREAEEFLKLWNDAVFDGKGIGDPELDREAALWRHKFPHIRIVGTSCGEHKVTHPIPVYSTSTSTMKSIMNHSKSADTIRDKVPNNSKTTLPRIADAKKVLRK